MNIWDVTISISCHRPWPDWTCSSAGFKLFSCDLRPADGIIINEALDIAGVNGWEFAYAALAEFTLEPAYY